jgi:hypothetical protein
VFLLVAIVVVMAMAMLVVVIAALPSASLPPLVVVVSSLAPILVTKHFAVRDYFSRWLPTSFLSSHPIAFSLFHSISLAKDDLIVYGSPQGTP